MQCPNRVRARVQKTDLYTPPSVAYGEAYSIRPYDRVRAILRNIDAILQLGTCGPSKNHPVFVPFGAVEWAYAIRPYNWVRAILRNTDAIFQLNTCGPSKNCPVFVPLRGRGVGVCDTPLQLGTCEGSKNGSVYATVGGVWWGVCDTPLRLDTCDSSKYRYDLSTGGAGAFGRWGGGGYRLRGRRA